LRRLSTPGSVTLKSQPSPSEPKSGDGPSWTVSRSPTCSRTSERSWYKVTDVGATRTRGVGAAAAACASVADAPATWARRTATDARAISDVGVGVASANQLVSGLDDSRAHAMQPRTDVKDHNSAQLRPPSHTEILRFDVEVTDQRINSIAQL
jgi:hypothetical protein